MNNSNRFWVLVVLITAALVSNFYLSFTSVNSNHARITFLEQQEVANKVYIRNVLIGIEDRSSKTTELVVEAITELTEVFRNSQHNDQKSLELLETIHQHLLERENAE